MIEVRDFARAMQAVEESERDPQANIEVTPMVELVREIRDELLQEMVQRQRAGQ